LVIAAANVSASAARARTARSAISARAIGPRASHSARACHAASTAAVVSAVSESANSPLASAVSAGLVLATVAAVVVQCPPTRLPVRWASVIADPGRAATGDAGGRHPERVVVVQQGVPVRAVRIRGGGPVEPGWRVQATVDHERDAHLA